VLNIALIDVAFWWMLFAIDCSKSSRRKSEACFKSSSTEHKPYECKRHIETVFGNAIEAFVFGKDISKAMIKINVQNVHYLFKISRYVSFI